MKSEGDTADDEDPGKKVSSDALLVYYKQVLTTVNFLQATRRAATCRRCKNIMYPGPANSPENHKRGFCSDGAKSTLATSKQNQDPTRPNKPAVTHIMPEWPQPEGIFTSGSEFHPLVFLSRLGEMYEKVVVDKESGHLLMEHQAFAALLVRRTITLHDGSVLFKIFDTAYPKSTPDGVVTVHEGLNYLKLDCLREPQAANVASSSTGAAGTSGCLDTT